MEANVCDVNQLGADVLLPPRKRLLAGFKKQSCNGYTASLHPPVVASSSSPSAPSPSPHSPCPSPPSPVPYSLSSVEFQNRLDNLLSSHFNNTQNLTPAQIVEASKSAANAAVRASKAARAAAQEKAIVAAKAVMAAKTALALVASSSTGETVSKEKCLKRNKMKKHVQVQVLYQKQQLDGNYGNDKELSFHRVMNSSSRISKHSSASDLKGNKSKKPKTSPACEKTGTSNGGVALAENPHPIGNGHVTIGELDSEALSLNYTRK